MPESLTVETALTDDIAAGAYLYVLAGASDTGLDDLPVSGRVPCRPKSATHPAHLEGGHLEGRHLQGVGDGGHLCGRHLEHGHLGFQDVVRWTGGNFCGPIPGTLGTHVVSVKIYDRDGRVSATTPPLTTALINTSPLPSRELAVTSKSGDQITFDFTASPTLTGGTGINK